MKKIVFMFIVLFGGSAFFLAQADQWDPGDDDNFLNLNLYMDSSTRTHGTHTIGGTDYVDNFLIKDGDLSAGTYEVWTTGATEQLYITLYMQEEGDGGVVFKSTGHWNEPNGHDVRLIYTVPSATSIRDLYVSVAVNSYSTTSYTLNWKKVADGGVGPPPSNLSATAKNNGVDLDWTAVSNADEYETQEKVGSSGTFSLFWRTSFTSVHMQKSLAQGTTYYYRIRAHYASGWSDWSPEVSMFYNYPPRPSNVTATDDTYSDKVRVTWSSVDQATHYRVYRATSSDLSYLSRTPVSSWQTSNSFDDTTAVAGTTYDYWVTAAKSSAGAYESAYSYSTTGRRAVTLSAPAGLSATDGTYTNKISTSWQSVSLASHYRVYRATSSTGTKTALSSWQTSLSYEDTTATIGQTYYYWVQAATSSSGANASDYSASDSGFRGLSSPSGVSASDGAHTDKVSISWNSVSGATHYRGYRATSSTGSKTELGSWQTSTSYDDTSVSAGVTYYYWVQAAVDSSGGKASGYSSSDSGWRAVAPPATPDGVSASYNTYDNKITLSWNSASGAASYEVWRSTGTSSSTATRIKDSLSGTSYTDISVSAGAVYYYWILAENAGGTSGFSSRVSGRMLKYDLHPYTPSGWDEPVVVTTNPDSTRNSSVIYDTQNVYIWHAVYNASGSDAVPPDFNGYRHGLYLWNIRYSSAWSPDSHQAGSWFSWRYNAGAFSPGTHSVTLKVDYGSVLNETDENNNNYSRTFTVIRDPNKPNTPQNVSATFDTYTDKIVLSWDADPKAASYEILKHTSNSRGSASLLEVQYLGTTYTDSASIPGVTYYYWVRSKNSLGASDYSAGVSGRSQLLAADAPQNVLASIGQFTDKVVVSWDSVFPATHYRVYRAESSSGEKTALGNWHGATSFDDTGATPGVDCYYWVKAAIDSSGMAESEFSAEAIGRRSLAYTLNLVSSPSQGGAVSGGSNMPLAPGSFRSVSANEAAGWKFSHWNDGITNASRVITVPNHDVTYIAYFAEKAFELAPPKISMVDNGEYASKIRVVFHPVNEADSYRLYSFRSRTEKQGILVASEYEVRATTPQTLEFELSGLDSGYRSWFRAVSVKDGIESPYGNAWFGATKKELGAPNRLYVSGETNAAGCFAGSVRVTPSALDGALIKYRINDDDIRTTISPGSFSIINLSESEKDYLVEVWYEMDGRYSESATKLIVDGVEVDSVCIAPTSRVFRVATGAFRSKLLKNVTVTIQYGQTKRTAVSGNDGYALFSNVPYLADVTVNCYEDQPLLDFKIIAPSEKIAANNSALTAVWMPIYAVPMLHSISAADYFIPGETINITFDIDDPNRQLDRLQLEIEHLDTGRIICSKEGSANSLGVRVVLPTVESASYKIKIWGEYSINGDVEKTEVHTKTVTSCKRTKDRFTAQADGKRSASFTSRAITFGNIEDPCYCYYDAQEQRMNPLIRSCTTPVDKSWIYEKGKTDIRIGSEKNIFGWAYANIDSRGERYRSIFSIPVDDEFRELAGRMKDIDLSNLSLTLTVDSGRKNSDCRDRYIELFGVPYADSFSDNNLSFHTTGVHLGHVRYTGEKKVIFNFSDSAEQFKSLLQGNPERIFFGIRFEKEFDEVWDGVLAALSFETDGRKAPLLEFDYTIFTQPQQAAAEPMMMLSDESFSLVQLDSSSSPLSSVTNLISAIDAYRRGRLTEYGMLLHLAGVGNIDFASSSNMTVSATRDLPEVLRGMSATNITLQIDFPHSARAALLVDAIDPELNCGEIIAPGAAYLDQLPNGSIAALWQYPNETLSISYSVQREWFRVTERFHSGGTLYWVDYSNRLYAIAVEGDLIMESDLDQDGFTDRDEMCRGYGFDPYIPNAAVNIMNLSARQIPGTRTVEIVYDLYGWSTNDVPVSLTVSNGTTAVVCSNVSGDVGVGVAAGTEKTILWNAGADWEGNFAELKFAVTASDFTFIGDSTRSSVDTRNYTLTVQSEHGYTIPVVGIHSNYCMGEVVVCSTEDVVNDGILWKVAGWVGTGSVPFSGTTDSTGVVILTNLNSSISWVWETVFCITNVAASQRPGTKLVEITYDIISDLAASADISLHVSNGGTLIYVEAVSGDIGAGVVPGMRKSMIWDAGADWNGNVSELTFVVKHTREPDIADAVVELVDSRNYYTVQFLSGAYGTLSGQAVQSVLYENRAIAPAVTPSYGWDFSGWDAAFDNITADTTVTATYTRKSYTVTFLPGANGTLAGNTVQSVLYEGGAIAPIVTPAYGWELSGWNVAFNYITANTTVSATYTRRNFTVTFLTGDHGILTGNTVQSIAYESGAIVPTVTPSYGWNFIGWDVAFNNITKDTTVTAAYTRKNYTVIFLAGAHGSLVGNTVQSVVYEGGATAPSVTPSYGWDFAGWDNTYNNVTADVTVAAIYTRKSYTVTFLPGTHGTLAGNTVQSVLYEGGATAPIVTPVYGWESSGWNVAFNHITANTYVTATYTRRNFTVTFLPGDHGTLTGQSILSVSYESGAVAPTVVPVAGWVFNDWDKTFDNITADTTVTATYIVDITSVSITGATYVDEGRTAQYSCELHYFDSSTETTSFGVIWSVVGNDASISRSGLLSARGVALNHTVTVKADYVKDGIAHSAEITVTINNTGPYGGGAGIVGDPYMIFSKEDLFYLAATTADYGRYFILKDDIDLAGEFFTGALIGPSTSTLIYNGIKFTGSFDGNGHVIRNLVINTPASGIDYLGLFGYLNAGAQISNLGVEDVSIIGSISASDYIGVLCGRSDKVTISNCIVSGSISGNNYVGGLCGRDTDGTIRNCYSMVTVSGDDYIGGFVGYLNRTSVTHCYSVGSVAGDLYSGGFIGRIYSGTTITGCFWDTQTSGYAISAAGTGRTTAQMQTKSTFTSAGWNFTDTWNMNGYPVLSCFNLSGTYSSWVFTQGLPVGLQAETDTPASDGIVNLLKYACGLPATDSCTTADLMSIADNGAAKFAILYFRAKYALDVDLEPVWASDLAGPWSPIGITTEMIQDIGEREQWKASIPLGNCGFFRLRATRIK